MSANTRYHITFEAPVIVLREGRAERISSITGTLRAIGGERGIHLGMHSYNDDAPDFPDRFMWIHAEKDPSPDVDSCDLDLYVARKNILSFQELA